MPALNSCLMCPRAQPDMADTVILGVRTGGAEATYISYLDNAAGAGGAGEAD